jgi:hypothetical protein
MGKSSGDSDTTLRFSQYIEDYHSLLLDYTATSMDEALLNNPFGNFMIINPDTIFLGANLAMGNLIGIFSLFQDHVNYVNPDLTYQTIIDRATQDTTIHKLINDFDAYLYADYQTRVYPDNFGGINNINNVMSEGYGQAALMITNNQAKVVAHFKADIDEASFNTVIPHWQSYLMHGQAVVDQYLKIMQTHYAAKVDETTKTLDVVEKYVLWPFRVLDYQRAFIGAMQQGHPSKSDSQSASYISGALGVASLGVKAYQAYTGYQGASAAATAATTAAAVTEGAIAAETAYEAASVAAVLVVG